MLGLIQCVIGAYFTSYVFHRIGTEIRSPGWIALIVGANWIMAWVTFWIPSKKEIEEYGRKEDAESDERDGAKG